MRAQQKSVQDKHRKNDREIVDTAKVNVHALIGTNSGMYILIFHLCARGLVYHFSYHVLLHCTR